MSPNDIYRKVSGMIKNLQYSLKKIILQFDPYMDSGRNIPNQELLLRLTEGKTAIIRSSAFYNLLPKLVDNDILMKDDKSCSYLVTSFGWKVWKKLLEKPEHSIPDNFKFQLNDIVSKIGKINHLSIYPEVLKIWSEKFSIFIRDLYEVLSKINNNKANREYISALGLITWNHLYQPILLKDAEFMNYTQHQFSSLKSRIYALCKFFNWEFCKLDDNLWFVCQDHHFWRSHYSILFRFYISHIPIDQIFNKSKDIGDHTIAFLKELNINRKINDLVFHKLARQIRSLKGYYWPREYKTNFSWLYPRLKTMLLKGK